METQIDLEDLNPKPTSKFGDLPKKKKLLIIGGVIGLFVLLIIIIIILSLSSSSENLKNIGEIECIFEIDDIHKKTRII